MERASRQGFTLIELSIVMVIIGLIVGGLLMGKDLIRAAQIRGTLSQLNQYRSAYQSFATKYGCIAGDCTNAESSREELRVTVYGRELERGYALITPRKLPWLRSIDRDFGQMPPCPHGLPLLPQRQQQPDTWQFF